MSDHARPVGSAPVDEGPEATAGRSWTPCEVEDCPRYGIQGRARYGADHRAHGEPAGRSRLVEQISKAQVGGGVEVGDDALSSDPDWDWSDTATGAVQADDASPA